MKICAFGTMRIDFHLYQKLNCFNTYDEIKVDSMNMNVGGSVYNSALVLNKLGSDVVLYTLNTDDYFTLYLKQELANIKYVINEDDENSSAMTLIFVDEDGTKKLISYDGKRKDQAILKQLKQDINKYQMFYTSCYEFNESNYLELDEIMSLCPCNFVDLSPMIYQLDVKIIDKILKRVHILSGTQQEFSIILNKLKIDSIELLKTKYQIDYLFVKQGSKGASFYVDNHIYSYKPSIKQTSHDTTGCGDTFNAMIINSIQNNLYHQEMLKKAVELASKVAYEGFIKVFKR